jgi:hypothetical protein
VIEELSMPKELEPYGWYVGSKDRLDYYLRQDKTIQRLVSTKDKKNGGYFVSETEALLARDEYYKKHEQESEEMKKVVNIEAMIGDALGMAEEAAEYGCGCGDIANEQKFLGQVYDHKGNFIETLHASKKKEFKEYLANPDNMGRRILVYRGVLAYSSDVPVNTHVIPKDQKKKAGKVK